MNRPFLLRPLSAQELLALQRLLRAHNTPVGLYRRCNLIWQLAAGYSIAEASEIAELHYTNAHKWVKRFVSKGLTGLQDLSRSGRPRIYSEEAETLVIETATSRPQDLQLGFTTWSLVKLEKHLRQFPQLESISRETIRHILSRHGLRFLTGQTWCESNDPEFEVKKTPS
jgi:transposase